MVTERENKRQRDGGRMIEMAEKKREKIWKLKSEGRAEKESK